MINDYLSLETFLFFSEIQMALEKENKVQKFKNQARFYLFVLAIQWLMNSVADKI